MDVKDNTSTDMEQFGNLSTGDSFKDEVGDAFMKISTGGSGENAVNISTGNLSTIAGATLINKVNADVTLTSI